MASANQVLNLLAQHQGADCGVAADALARRLQIPTRALRSLISHLRDDGIAICGSPKTGYFMAVTPEELQQSCAFLEHRAMHSLRLLSRMKKVSLPNLLGQLHLTETEKA